MRTHAGLVVAAVLLAMMPAVAFAQTSAISGTVKDTSGAILPGVTVEAASPALIEKVRSAVTDSNGQYKIEALRPGVYSVTFTLPGFSVVKRDNVELTSDFTATINAELRVGSLTYIGLDRVPGSVFRAYALAVRADRQNALQDLHFRYGGLQLASEGTLVLFRELPVGDVERGTHHPDDRA